MGTIAGMRFTRALLRPLAAAALFAGPVASTAAAQAPAAGPGGVVVHPAFGGFILGYDVDVNGDEGMLCEALTLANGNHDIAIETFYTTTGAIAKFVRRMLNSKDAFVTLGIKGASVGLMEFQHVSQIFVDHRRYVTLNPVAGNTFSTIWSPPLTALDTIQSVSATQGTPTAAFLGFHIGGNDDVFLFQSNVGANTFGPKLTITDPNFAWNDSPRMALDTPTNQALLGASNGCPNCPPELALFDLATGAEQPFNGLGFGCINGIAIDSAAHIACTSTEIDFSIQFYDLTTKSGFKVPIPGATSQAQSGQDVQFDPIHHLFLIGQVFSSSAPSGSSILVFDEQGNFVHSVDGLHLPASPVRIALIPARRTGFVLTAPDLTSLQSFTY